MFFGAPRTSAGLPVTRTSCTDHLLMLARLLSCLKEFLPFPDAGRFWEVCEKYKVNQFYTAPTAIRSLMGFGLRLVVTKYDLSSLKVIGSVGEPINEEAWEWYLDEHR